MSYAFPRVISRGCQAAGYFVFSSPGKVSNA